MVSIEVPEGVAERTRSIVQQLYVQKHISQHCGKEFASASAAIQAVKRQLPKEEFDRLVQENQKANAAKHVGFTKEQSKSSIDGDVSTGPTSSAATAVSGGGCSCTAAEAAKAAAVAGMEEQRMQLEAITQERDEASAEALRCRDQLELGESDLREKQEAIQAIIQN
eukprot:TRINITY_DN6399_c4_g1_i1.p1 TRINITY_DN6399_c4_g1~~TRINITY_DN6399_c4_g1_i1.p1  ORF type:complete len:167 (-),score=50.14 TRINITY_DN6399_c4_g1_i1:219-719(-)